MRLTHRLITATAVLGALTLLTIGTVAVPSILSMRRLRTEIQQEYLDIERQYSIRRQLGSSQKIIENIRPTLRKLLSMAVTEGNELEFIRTLEQAADRNGINQSISLETVNQNDITAWEKDIPVTILTNGSYGATIAYLDSLHSLPYQITVRSLSMSAQGNGSESANIRTEIRGTIRWLAKDHPVIRQSERNP
ncbi:hypothetical protein JW899_01795 [Candidatus Uhrbacteria bacterium]|nr:hypothetical protein [Candidatus Uhrbacteria bacterium]